MSLLTTIGGFVSYEIQAYVDVSTCQSAEFILHGSALFYVV